MTYETYQYIFVISLCFSVFMLLTTIYIFIKLKIWNVIGEITGRNAKKGINSIYKNSEQNFNRTYSLKLNRNFVTDKISNSSQFVEKTYSNSQTEILTDNQEKSINATVKFTIREEIKFISCNEIIH